MSDEVGEVCLDCPVWAWDEQPSGIYGFDNHPLGFGDLVHVHPWRGARLVPVDDGRRLAGRSDDDTEGDGA